MKIITRVLCYSFLCGLVGGPIGAQEEAHKNWEKEPLLSPNINTYPSENQGDLNQTIPPENRRSRIFRINVDRLKEKFNNFASLPLNQQDTLLNKYRNFVAAYGIEMGLTRGGFNEGLEISKDTSQKLKSILKIYDEHSPKNRTCAIV